MKKLLGVLVVILFVGASAYAQSLDPADRERAVKYLEATRKNILETTKGLSEAQWNFKPAPDRWSVAEAMEHIAAAEDMPDRTNKAQAPDALKPTNRYGSPEAALKPQQDSQLPRKDGRSARSRNGQPARQEA